MKRRNLLLGAAALAAPRIARAEGASVLRFVPYVDLAVLDPVTNTNAITRTHAFLVFDTLFGVDASMRVQNQMAEGVVADADSRDWTITLREGLRFHDDTPVLGRDVAASIRRWGARDVFAMSLMEVVDEISAPTDRTVRFRLKSSFRLLPDALGKLSPNMPAIMPERLAAHTDPFKSVAELIGSGPFRFVANERVPGARVVYEKFQGYVPRPDGAASLTAGPKRVMVDRVEWLTMPETATAMAALQSGEVDWLETPPPDLLPTLRKDSRIKVAVHDATGQVAILRFNCLIPPFDNQKLRRAVLRAVDQTEFMNAYSADESLWHVNMGLFPVGTPMASIAGLEGLFGRTDLVRARAEVAASGYQGERVVIMSPTDHPVNGPMANVAADLFRKIGLNVDQQSMDSGTMFQRRNNKLGLDKGGWNVFPSAINGLGQLNPADSFLARGNGEGAWYGWPTSPRTEELHSAYLQAATLEERKRICAELQVVALEEAPSIPLGQIVSPTAYRRTLSGVSDGFPRFWGISKT
jgi:peptide/nickel transport system substrate-binding protein